MPQISVIVPVYKVEEYLHRCVDSILDQTFRDFELILVDDGSPDGCPAICDEYAAQDDRVQVIHQENGGLSAARNAGIDWVFVHSDSQWFSLVDSDDWVHPRYLECLLDAAVKKNVAVSICGYAETSGEEPLVLATDMAPQSWVPEDFYVANNVNATIAWGKLYRRECFTTLRYPVGKLHEDEFVTYRILFGSDNIAAVPAPLYCYYGNPESITTSVWTPRRLSAMEAFDEQLQFFEENGYEKALVRRVQAYLWVLGSHYYGACAAQEKYRTEIREIKRKTQWVLRKYRSKIDYNWTEYATVEEILHPYWHRIKCGIREIQEASGEKEAD